MSTAPVAIVATEDVVKRYRGGVRALDGVSLALTAGRTLGVVGESGCGKSTLARLLVGLERPTAGVLRFRGAPYRRSARGLRPVRRAVSMVFQDPYASLDPRFRVGEIVAEPLRAHGRYGRDGRRRVAELLERVGLAGLPLDGRSDALSGGQRQRLGIARALAMEPAAVILDEPTSALDVSVQAQILNLLLDLQRERDLGYLFISHDLQVVRRMSDDVAVLYAGTVVEHGPAAIVSAAPRHPYTAALLAAVPGTAPDARRLEVRVKEASGLASAARTGCPFAPRCPLVQERCRVERPPLAGGEHRAACWFPLG